MLPTLKPGTDVLVFCWFYTPKVGDIVAFKKDEKEMIKRIQKIKGKIFVSGDNTKESTDSRNFGWIKREDIIGKVILVF